MNNKQKSIRFAAGGDLLLCRSTQDEVSRGLEALSEDVLELLSDCDLVFANLECTLPGKDTVPTEPLVLSSVQQIKTLANSPIQIVTLGNNHSFDCFDRGFERITNLLDKIGVNWFGAGRNINEAEAPETIEIKGIAVAFIGFVDQSSGPYSYADHNRGGVAPLDADRVCEMIGTLKQNSDHVVVTTHWGMERFRIPSPLQVRQAHAFIEAGASMILGHHPHVLQGVEYYKGAPIAYSLGNFMANNVYWQNGDYLTWNRFERTGLVLVAELNKEKILDVKLVPIYDNGKKVMIDKSGQGEIYIDRANQLLHNGITEKSYKQERFFVETIKPIMAQMKWSKLSKIRPAHFGKLIKLLNNKS